MTGETVERSTGKLMTPGAELSRRIDRNMSTLTIFADMAIDTAGKAVIRLANTLVDRDVTLVLYQLEVVAAHESGRRHAGIQLVRLRRPLYTVARLHGTQAHREAKAQRQQQTKAKVTFHCHDGPCSLTRPYPF